MRQRFPGILMAAAVGVIGLMLLWTSDRVTDVREEFAERAHAADYSRPIAAVESHARELREAVIELETEIARERLAHLPDDATQWHTSLFVQPDWKSRAAENRAVELFSKQPELVALKQRTHWHLVTVDSPIYQQSFAAECPVTPCLLVTRADGTVIYKESGSQLGTRPRNLWHAVRAQIRRHCPDGKCVPPLRFPDAPPDAPAPPDKIPDTQPEVKPDDDLLPMLACGFAGILLVVAVVLKRDLSS